MAEPVTIPAAGTSKGPEAFRTISEASHELGVPQHVLRFWETRFSFIRPMKRAGGRRFYRRQDLEVLAGVRSLLHQQGYTIKGVQRLHKEFGLRRLVAATKGDVQVPPAGPDPAIEADAAAEAAGAEEAARGRLRAVLDDLEAAKARIDALLHIPARS